MPTRSPTEKSDPSCADRDHLANDLVPRNDAGPVDRQVTLGDVQIGAADATGRDRDEQLVGSGLRQRRRHVLQGPVLIGPGWRTRHADIVPEALTGAGR